MVLRGVRMPPDFPALEPLARAPPLGLSCGIRREKSYRPVDPLIRSVRFCQKSLAVGGPSPARAGSFWGSIKTVDLEPTVVLSWYRIAVLLGPSGLAGAPLPTRDGRSE